MRYFRLKNDFVAAYCFFGVKLFKKLYTNRRKMTHFPSCLNFFISSFNYEMAFAVNEV